MWMKNTLIPLSVAFVDEKGKIVSISDMQPQTETSPLRRGFRQVCARNARRLVRGKSIKSGTTIQDSRRLLPRARRCAAKKAGWRVPAGLWNSFYPEV